MLGFFIEVFIIAISLLLISFTFTPLFIILGASMIILILLKDIHNIFQ